MAHRRGHDIRLGGQAVLSAARGRVRQRQRGDVVTANRSNVATARRCEVIIGGPPARPLPITGRTFAGDRRDAGVVTVRGVFGGEGAAEGTLTHEIAGAIPTTLPAIQASQFVFLFASHVKSANAGAKKNPAMWI